MAGEVIDLFGRPIIDLTPNPLQPLLDAKSLFDVLPFDCLEPVRDGPAFSTKVMASALVATTLVAGSVAAKTKPLVFAQGAPAPAVESDEVFVTGDSLMVGELAAGLPGELTAQGFRVIGTHAEESTRFVPDGIAVLEDNLEAIAGAETIVAAYGANRSLTGDDVGDALDFFRRANEIGSRDNRPPTIIVPEVTAPILQPANQALKRAVALANQEGMKVVFMERDDGTYQAQLASDQVHYHDYSPMAASDAQLLAQLLAPSVNEPDPTTSPTVPPTTPPPAKPTEVALPPEDVPPAPLNIPIAKTPDTVVMPHLAKRQAMPPTSVPIDIQIGGNRPNTIPSATLSKPIAIPIISQEGTSPAPALQEIATSEMPAVIDRLPSDTEVSAPEPQTIIAGSTAEPEPTAPTTPENRNQEIIAKAAEYGIFYDPSTGQARQYLGDFIDREEQPELEVSEPFGDYRVRSNGPYRQGDTDFRSGQESRRVIAPAVGIAETYYTSGEGNKVVVRMGVDPETGMPFRWWDKHLSEIFVEPGQLVLPGDLLGYTGETGDSSGIHHSVGITSHEDDMTEYINFQEAQGQHVLDYMPNVPVVCPPPEDDIEICGPTVPGVYRSVPVDLESLSLLGIPEYLEGATPLPPEPEPAVQPIRLAISISGPESDADGPKLVDIAAEIPVTPAPADNETPDYTPPTENPFSVFDPPEEPAEPISSSTGNLPDEVPDVGRIDEDSVTDDDFPPVPAPTTPPVAEEPEAPPSEEPAEPEPPATPEPVAPPEALYPNEVAVPAALSQTYWIDESGGVHAEELFKVIEQRWPIPAESEMFAANSRYRILDEIPGVPYGFSDIASYPERYGNLKLVATSIIMPLEYKKFKAEFEARTGQIIDEELRFSDADSPGGHNEHGNGGDIDWLLINNLQARHEFANRIADWQEPGGKPWFDHMVTGEASLEAEGDAFVASVGQERPNFIYQPDHGSNPAVETHHIHLSIDEGYGGPFDIVESHVPTTSGLHIPEPPLARGMDWDGLYAWAQETAQNVLGPVNPPAPEPVPEPTPTPEPELSPIQARRELLTADPLAFADPEWRELAWEANARPENAGINDARLPLTVLWVENRGFPEDPYGISAVSGANARGWFQVLPQTHFGWNTGVDSWYGPNGEENYLNESLYSSSGVGRDGDGDGIRNPDNPRDAIAAAFQVMPGTLGDPITFEGLTGDPTVDIYNAIFVKDEETLLSRIANYNGDGRTPDHVTLGTLAEMYFAGDPSTDQNKAYIVMGYALLATDLQFGVLPDHEANTFYWVDSQTLQRVSPQLVRATVTGH